MFWYCIVINYGSVVIVIYWVTLSVQSPSLTDNFKKYRKKTNPKKNILKILVYKIQPEITNSKIFMRVNFITKLFSQEQIVCKAYK